MFFCFAVVRPFANIITRISFCNPIPKFPTQSENICNRIIIIYYNTYYGYYEYLNAVSIDFTLILCCAVVNIIFGLMSCNSVLNK